MINENKVRVIGKYINKSGNRMLVISSLDGSFMKILNYSEFRKTQKPISDLSDKISKQDVMNLMKRIFHNIPMKKILLNIQMTHTENYLLNQIFIINKVILLVKLYQK